MYRTPLAAGLFAFIVLSVLLGWGRAQPQPVRPPPPDKYKIVIRYDIQAPRDQHVAQYKAMIGRLDQVGFEFEPKLKPFPNTDYEDQSKNTLTGFIAADRALRCFGSPNVAALLLLPANYQLPEDPAQPVRVRLELASGFPQARQLALADQVRALLGFLDFKESVGYDDRGYGGRPHTRLVGSIPVEQLPKLLNDLRARPTGGPAPQIGAATLPAPVSQIVPITVTEVLSGPAPALDAAKQTSRGQGYLDKIGPELWALITSKDGDTKIVRAEIILSYVPAAGDEGYREALLKEAPSLSIEGRLGPVVTALVRVNQASGLSGLPQVSVVRLAQPSLVRVDSSLGFAGDNAQVLKLSGLDELHRRGFKGQGIRIGIVDSDFRGYEAFVQSGTLPRPTRLLDLTAEFNPDLYPDPPSTDDKAVGHGTHCALAAALAAPEADITLIRIDPASLPQVQLVARLVNGEPGLDDCLTRRLDEIKTAAQILAGRREEIFKERNPILENYADDSELKRVYEILGPSVRGWLFTPREWHYRRVVELEQEVEQQRQLEGRFYRLFDNLKKLKGLHIVATSLVWNDGYPLGGASPLSRWFDAEVARKALWLVSAGNTQGQTWTGPYRDVDGNGVMEFAAPGTKLRPGSWTSELNFLAWQPFGAGQILELPEKATVRLTMQWQEPHDPAFFWNPKDRDRYLKPLANASLTVLRQRDPSGKVLAADDFELVGRSSVPAFRIENHPDGSWYEQLVEFTVPKSGRFALRVERQLPTHWELRKDAATGQLALVERTGLAATGIRPADAANLSALQTRWEMRPRIFVSVADAATAARGRVVFRDYSTAQGSIPILADTRALVAVGAATLDGAAEPYAAAGAPGTLWNFTKPNIFAFDHLTLTPPGTGSAFGSSLATPFAAGMAATSLSAGVRPQILVVQMRQAHGALWRLGK